MNAHTIDETLTLLEKKLKEFADRGVSLRQTTKDALRREEKAEDELQRRQAKVKACPHRYRNKAAAQQVKVKELQDGLDADMSNAKAYWDRVRQDEWGQLSFISYMWDGLMTVLNEWFSPVESEMQECTRKRENLQTRLMSDPSLQPQFDQACRDEENCRYKLRLLKKEVVCRRFRQLEEEKRVWEAMADDARKEQAREDNLQRAVRDAQEMCRRARREKEEALNAEDVAQNDHKTLMVELVRRVHKRLAALNKLPAPNKDGLAYVIPWGRINGWDGQLELVWPRGLPLAQSQYGEHSEANIRLIGEIAVQTLVRSKPGSVRVVAMDPVQLGMGLRIFQTTPPILDGGRIFTLMDECEALLQTIVRQMTTTIQRDIGSSYRHWRELHDDSGEHPYTLLIISNAQRLLLQGSSACQQALQTILTMGKNGGVGVLMTLDTSSLDDRQMSKLDTVLRDSGVEEIWMPSKAVAAFISKHPTLHMKWGIGSEHTAEEITEALAKQSLLRQARTGTLPDLWKPEAIPDHSSCNELRIPIGWVEGVGKQHDLVFNSQDAPHAFIGGQTGSGKSVLLHVILHSLLSHYNEEELTLYLLDFKEGVEMAVYARHPVPPVKLIAMQCDVDYALSFLNELEKQMQQRNRIFQHANACTKFDDYRAKGNKMPRILVIIDECQTLFNSSDSIRVKDIINSKMDNLVRKSRNVGIHFLFCTQTLSQLGSLSSLWSNVKTRIALQCKERDSNIILSPRNSAACKLKGKGDAIYNDGNGEPESNILLRIPLCINDDPIPKQHLLQMQDPAHRVRVYDGVRAPVLPEVEQLHAACSPDPALVLGATPDFEAASFRIPLTLKKEFPTHLCMLACIEPEALHKGMLQSCVRSAAASDAVSRLIVVGMSEAMPDILRQEKEALGEETLAGKICYRPLGWDEAARAEVLEELLDTDATAESQIIILFYGWHNMDLPVERSTYGAGKNNPVTNHFISLLEGKDKPYVHCILMADVPVKVLPSLSLVPTRLAHCNNQEYATKLLLGSLSVKSLGVDDTNEHRYNIAYAERGGGCRLFRGFVDPLLANN